MKLVTTETFCATHHLPHQGGKCMNLHGHNYRADITIEVPDRLMPDDGMLIDFGDIKSILNAYDHAIIIKGTHLLDDGVKNKYYMDAMRGKALDDDLKALAIKHDLKLVDIGMETTAENIARCIINEIASTITKRVPVCHTDLSIQVALWETDKHCAVATF